MKKIIFCLIFVLMFTTISEVKAQIDDTLFISRGYNDIYAVQEYKTGGHRMYRGKIYYMTKGNTTEIGYCIELGANLSAIYYSSTNDYSMFGLSKEQSDYIRLVAYYGYEYPNHYDRFYYFAAQEIIWEYLTGDQIYWVNAEDYDASQINLDSYKNEIINLVNRHYIAPSFVINSINYKGTIELVDSNNILDEYKVDEVKNANYTVNGNKIILTSINFDDIEISLSRKINRNTNTTDVYYYATDSQAIVSTGLVDNNLVKYTIPNNGVKLKINKKDYDTDEYIRNSNVGFKLYDVDNARYIGDIYNVNEDGYVVISNIKDGNYKIEEVDLGINDYLFNDESFDFVINEDNLIYDNGYIYNVDFYNYKPVGEIEINKKGEEFTVIDGDYYYQEINLPDVIFDIITCQDIVYDNSNYLENDIIASIKTDENGIAKINNLPLGKYIIKEKEVDSSYELDDKEYEIELVYKDAYTNIISKSIEINNYLKKTNLVITKIDSDSNEVLEGVLIKVYDSNNQNIYTDYTNKDGQIVLEDLVYGIYYIKEIMQLDGYKLDDNIYQIELNNDNNELIISNDKIDIPPKTSYEDDSYLVFIILLIINFCFIGLNLWYNRK